MKDIILKKIIITNFLSIGNVPVEINFKVGLNGITGINYDLTEIRSNGVGKSAISDAIFYSLYGETIRNIKTSGIKNYITDKKGLVILYFSVNNIEYIIERGIAPHNIKFYEDGIEKTKSTLSENNNYIYNIINCSPELAKNSIFTSINDTIPFMAQDAKLKRKFSEGILNITFISEILKGLREEYNLIQKDYDKVFSQLENSKKNKIQYDNEIVLWENNKNILIETINNRIIDIQNKIINNKSLIINIDEESEKLKYDEIINKILTIEKELESRKSELKYAIDDAIGSKHKINIFSLSYKSKNTADDINNKILGYEKEIINFGEVISEELELSKLEQEKIILQDKLENLHNSINGLNLEINNLSLNVRDLNIQNNDLVTKNNNYNSLSGICPTCLHSLEGSNKDHLKIHINENNNLIINNKLKIEEYEKSINENSIVILELQKSLNNINLNYDNLIKEYNKNIKIRSKIRQLNSEIELLKSSLENDSCRQNMWDNYQNQIKEYDEVEKTKKESLDKLLPKIEELQLKKTKVINSYETILNTIKSNNKIKQDITSDEKLIENYQSQKETKEKEECRFIVLLENINKEINILESKLKLLDIELKAGEILKGVFSEEGAKTYITKKIIDVLNRRIAYYIQKYQFKIRIVLDEFFEDTIYNPKGESCSYFNFSGAERKSIDLAILFAFIDLRKIQGDININTLFFDEILDSSMDKTGIEITLDILKERVEKFNEAVYVISHRKESLLNFDGEIIELEKRNGTTIRK